MNIAIILARGGSKRVPRKNVLPIRGIPALAYPIRAARASQVFDEVHVSTDDAEIADIALAHDASVPRLRSFINSGDKAAVEDAVYEVLGYYDTLDRRVDLAAIMYGTSVFVTADMLRTAIQTLKKTDWEMVMSIKEYDHPIQRALYLGPLTGRICFVWPQYQDSNTQDLEERYHDAAQFYMVRVSAFMAAWSQRIPILRMKGPGIVVEGTWDIDEPRDVPIVEALLEARHGA